MLFLGAVFLLVGTFAGTLAGLFGIGGGIILVPAMSTLFQMLGATPDNAMRVAVATSLATIIPTSIASLRAHHRRGGIDWALLKHWSPMIIIGAILGSLGARYISSEVLKIMFGCLLIYMASRFLMPPVERQDTHQVSKLLQRLMAFAIGGSSAMLGVGGGVIGVPALSHVGLALKRAIGTASTFGVMVAVPGVINYLAAPSLPDMPYGGTFGLIHPLALALLVPGALIGAPLGAKLSHALPVAQLRRAFGALVLLLGIRMLYTGIF